MHHTCNDKLSYQQLLKCPPDTPTPNPPSTCWTVYWSPVNDKLSGRALTGMFLLWTCLLIKVRDFLCTSTKSLSMVLSTLMGWRWWTCLDCDRRDHGMGKLSFFSAACLSWFCQMPIWRTRSKLCLFCSIPSRPTKTQVRKHKVL